MKEWVDRFVDTTDEIVLAFLFLLALALIGVGVKFSLEYAVNSARSPQHWVVYHLVEPAKSTFRIGEHPMFISNSEWFKPITTEWPDVMWCTDIEGPAKGLIRKVRGPHERENKLPGRVGFYDEQGNIEEGSTSGLWLWRGDVPQYPSDCFLKPAVMLYPSPLVEIPYHLPPTRIFHFRD